MAYNVDKVPLATTFGAVVGVVRAIPNFQANGLEGGLATYTQVMTGYNIYTGTWSWTDFMQGGGPLLIGMGVSIAGRKLGVNRQIAKIPFIGKYLSL